MRSTRRVRRSAAVLVGAFLGGVAGADNGAIGLVAENDSLVGTDRNYTSGIKLVYTTSAAGTPGWARAAGRRLPGIDGTEALQAGCSLSHEIYTPQRLGTTRPLPDQRPYAGLLYATVAIVGRQDHRLDTWAVDFGMLGPAAGAESLQNTIHDWLGSDQARGWGNQLSNEPVLALRYERQWRRVLRGPGDAGSDAVIYAGGSAGNLATYGQFGFSLRAGSGLASDFGPPRVRPALAGTGWFNPSPGFSGYVFAGAGVRAVAYNVLLDGNTWTDSLSVDKEPLVGDAQAGVVLSWGRTRVALTYVYRSREFKTQDDPDAFGALAFMVGL